MGEVIYMPNGGTTWGDIVNTGLHFDRYWMHVEATINLDTQQMDFSYQQVGGNYEQFGEGIASGSGSFNYGVTGHVFRFN